MDGDIHNVFQFLAVRGVDAASPTSLRAHYILDTELPAASTSERPRNETRVMLPRVAQSRPELVLADLFSSTSGSRIGRLVGQAARNGVDNDTIIADVESALGQTATYGPEQFSVQPILQQIDYFSLSSDIPALQLGALNQRPYWKGDDVIWVAPSTLSDIATPLAVELARARQLALVATKFGREAVNPKAQTSGGILSDFWNALLKLFGASNDTGNATPTRKQLLTPFREALVGNTADTSLIDLVFDTEAGTYQPGFATTRRILFDALYGLYVIRRAPRKVLLEPPIAGLQACHLLETLAIVDFLMKLCRSSSSDSYVSRTSRLRANMNLLLPELTGLVLPGASGREVVSKVGLPLFDAPGDFEACLSATPVIHPIFARLSSFFQPFNTLAPIGVGDLMVVKQKFRGYRKAEIAHIETVLAGESKTRVHRRLDKTEDSTSYSSSTDTETTKDTQTTTRFELKKEVDKSIQENLGVNANASVTYNQGPVSATLGGGLAFSTAKSESTKTASNFARDVVEKATSRIQTKTSESRTRTMTSEAEETNTHGFTNPATNGNISGIYRWLEKVY